MTRSTDRTHRSATRHGRGIRRKGAAVSGLGRAAALALSLALPGGTMAGGIVAGGVLTAGMLAMPSAALAQGLFSPVVQINGKVVTRYEVQQRALFFKVLSAPGDPEKMALERLIEERLQQQVADQMGISLTPEQIIAGQAEFAERANLNREAMIAALTQEGVEEQTFRDFVSAGLLWREVVQARFGSLVTISEQDVARELSDARPGTDGLRVLYSEIIIPYEDRPQREEAYALARQLRSANTADAFSAAARQYSAAPSRDDGGRIDWVSARDMQPGLLQMLLALGPGQVTEAIPLQGAIAVLQLRAVSDGLPPPASGSLVDYAVYLIPGGRSPAALAEAARVQTQSPTCNDLYELNRRQKGPAERLERVSGPMASVPSDIALELARMDPGEFSTGVTRGDFLALIMLCSRERPLPDDVTRERVMEVLRNRQLQQLAENYLAELRDAAVIRRP